MSAASLTACSDDDDNPIPQAPPRSMITEFVTPNPSTTSSPPSMQSS